MSFIYTPELLNKAFTYQAYRQHLDKQVAQSAPDEGAQKMLPYVKKNIELMAEYDINYKVNNQLQAAVAAAPRTTWLVLTEGWCGDAAFNLPVMAAIEKTAPEKVKLRLLLRDSNLALMDAYLTEGGRSIPKLIVVNNDLKELATWGPQPAALRSLVKTWKSEGAALKELILKVQEWYTADETQSVQGELLQLVKGYAALK